MCLPHEIVRVYVCLSCTVKYSTFPSEKKRIVKLSKREKERGERDETAITFSQASSQKIAGEDIR